MSSLLQQTGLLPEGSGMGSELAQTGGLQRQDPRIEKGTPVRRRAVRQAGRVCPEEDRRQRAQVPSQRHTLSVQRVTLGPRA